MHLHTIKGNCIIKFHNLLEKERLHEKKKVAKYLDVNVILKVQRVFQNIVALYANQLFSTHSQDSITKYSINLC
jgi:hypothetical protein